LNTVSGTAWAAAALGNCTALLALRAARQQHLLAAAPPPEGKRQTAAAANRNCNQPQKAQKPERAAASSHTPHKGHSSGALDVCNSVPTLHPLGSGIRCEGVDSSCKTVTNKHISNVLRERPHLEGQRIGVVDGHSSSGHAIDKYDECRSTSELPFKGCRWIGDDSAP